MRELTELLADEVQLITGQDNSSGPGYHLYLEDRGGHLRQVSSFSTGHPDSARGPGSRIEDAARYSGSRMKTGPALNTAWGPGPRIESRMYFRAPHGVHDPAVGPTLKSGSRTVSRPPHCIPNWIPGPARRP